MSEVSEKQVEANHRNGFKGGVKTEEGKEKVRLNALKHGLLSKEVCLESESRESLEELFQGMSLALKPEGQLEAVLADRIVTGMWRLRRVLIVEKNMLELRGDELMITLSEENVQRKKVRDMLQDQLFERLMRYETTIERGIYRALHELQRLQAMRKGQSVNLPVALDVQGLQE